MSHPSKLVINKLYEMYREENEKLFRILGRRISSWDALIK